MILICIIAELDRGLICIKSGHHICYWLLTIRKSEKWKDYQGKISACDITPRIVLVILSWSVEIKQKCQGIVVTIARICFPLSQFSTEPAARDVSINDASRVEIKSVVHVVDWILCAILRKSSSGFRWFPYSLMKLRTSPFPRHGEWRMASTASFAWRNWRKWQRWWPQRAAASKRPTLIEYRVDVICVYEKSILFYYL